MDVESKISLARQQEEARYQELAKQKEEALEKLNQEKINQEQNVRGI